MRVDLKHPLTGPDGHRIAWYEFRRVDIDDLIAVEDFDGIEACKRLGSRLSGIPYESFRIDAEDVPNLMKACGDVQRPFADAMALAYPAPKKKKGTDPAGENGPQS